MERKKSWYITLGMLLCQIMRISGPLFLGLYFEVFKKRCGLIITKILDVIEKIYVLFLQQEHFSVSNQREESEIQIIYL